jgi:SAM-dependent methyltransferase
MSNTPDPNEERFRNFERDGYSRVAGNYAAKTAVVFSKANSQILDAASVSGGSRILDVACGPGFLAADAAKRGATAAGIDFAPNMVAIARSMNPGADIREGDAQALPFADRSFDAVVCSLGILHFPHPEKAASEAYRVLDGNGHYALTTWAPPASDNLMGLIIGTIQSHGTMDVDLPPGPPLFRFGVADECIALLEGAGFVDVSVSEVNIEWDAQSPEAFYEEVRTSSARLSSLLEAQPGQMKEKVRNAILDGAKKYSTDGQTKVPIAFLLTRGRKP